MPADYCTTDGCEKFAISVGHWRGRGPVDNPHPPRPRRCRAHYLEAAAGEFETVKVVGAVRVVDARTGESVPAGRMVELDPASTNIRALVAAGFVERATAAKPAKAGRDA